MNNYEKYFKVCALSDKSLTPVYFYFKGDSKVKILNTLNIWFLKEDWLFIVAPYGRRIPKTCLALSTRKEVSEILHERMLEINFTSSAFDVPTLRQSKLREELR